MDAQQHLRDGRLAEALAALQADVRAKPADIRPRFFLFQLLCVMGEWKRALSQLEVLAELNTGDLLLAEVYRQAIQCELLRAEVFAAKRSPVIFGEPVEWIGWWVQATQLMARGEWIDAIALRNRALEAAPANPGTLDGTSFEWLMDADARFGPVLELILEGAYFWVPLFRIQEIELDVPDPPELRNAVWAPARLTWTNGGAAHGFIPTRYPGTEHASDSLARLARQTEWREAGGELMLGTGQRMFATPSSHHLLLELDRVEFLPL
jgi:type VI secretion system protein ImpE